LYRAQGIGLAAMGRSCAGGVHRDSYFDEPEVYFLLTEEGRLRVGDTADSRYRMSASAPKIDCRQTEHKEGNMDLGLKGLRAVVTGGSKGIGRAASDIFAQEGASVAICARNADEVKAAVKALTEKGVQAYGAGVDVADKAALQKFIADSAQALGGIDILVANVSALAAQDVEESWSQSFDVDMMHTVNAVTAALPYLEKSKHPSIVIVSSVSGREVDFTGPAYGAMKAALIHYAQRLAYQHASKMIRVNSVSPGNTYFDGGIWQNIETNLPDLFKSALSLNPTGRMAKPEEIGRGIVFLASPASSYTTGTNLVIDGALTKGVQL
jgi:3-oxoacyl-[acyl-carrier protein] reductase